MSQGDARVGLDRPYDLPDEFLLKISGRAFVAEIAWRSRKQAGVRFMRNAIIAL